MKGLILALEGPKFISDIELKACALMYEVSMSAASIFTAAISLWILKISDNVEGKCFAYPKLRIVP